MSYILAEKMMGLCSCCDTSWVDWCARFPDLFEKTTTTLGVKYLWFKDYNPNIHNDYIRKYEKYKMNREVSGVEFADSDGQPIFLCRVCLGHLPPNKFRGL